MVIPLDATNNKLLCWMNGIEIAARHAHTRNRNIFSYTKFQENSFKFIFPGWPLYCNVVPRSRRKHRGMCSFSDSYTCLYVSLNLRLLFLLRETSRLSHSNAENRFHAVEDEIFANKENVGIILGRPSSTVHKKHPDHA